MPHQLPRTFRGVDRAEEGEALFTFGLQGVMEEHGVILKALDRDAISSPEEMNIVKAILRDFRCVI